MPFEHRYFNEYPGWCTCGYWCDTERDFLLHRYAVNQRRAHDKAAAEKLVTDI